MLNLKNYTRVSRKGKSVNALVLNDVWGQLLKNIMDKAMN